MSFSVKRPACWVRSPVTKSQRLAWPLWERWGFGHDNINLAEALSRLCRQPGKRSFPKHTHYFTVNSRLSLWLLNSGAYMHWMAAMPVWYWPRSSTRVEYSKT
jgi:hypothetical protein